ncbi:hypothetical protein [Bacillus sp. NPDC060175]|uniref:hypothetical protein n=1 Tax=Bacillus sp. NPDC060175 TaxID=3347061 RepID=UPI00365F8116
MIKTLLAGTLLSTGLFAGGAIGTEDVKSDQKVEKSKYSETIERPEGIDYQPAFEIGSPENSEHAKTVERPEGTDYQPAFEMGDSEKSEHVKTVEKSEGTGTNPQQGKMVPTKEGN